MTKVKVILRGILIVTLLGVALFSAAKIGAYFYEGYTEQRFYDSLAEDLNDGGIDSDEKDSLTAAGEAGDLAGKFARLWDINEDVVGWIKIRGTGINYPVVQAEDNEFYLEHNLMGERSARGSIFMDCNNMPDGENYNTVVYGHNMKDGSMFMGLMKYKEMSFFEGHQYIEFDFPDERTNWRIFSVYICRPEEGHFQVVFRDAQEYWAYLEGCVDRSLYDTGVNVDIDGSEPMLTLVTCTYEYEDARLIIHAKRVGGMFAG